MAIRRSFGSFTGSGYVSPPIAEVPTSQYGLGDVISGAGQAAAGVINAKEEERKRKIQEQQLSEDRLIKLLPILSMFEKGDPDNPDPIQGTQIDKVQSPGGIGINMGMDSADLSKGPDASAYDPYAGTPFAGRKLAAPVLGAITNADGTKTQLPGGGLRGMLEKPQVQEIDELNVKDPKETVTQEVWDQLPEFYRQRWQPGKMIRKSEMGQIGQEIFKAAATKAQHAADAEARAAIAAEAAKDRRAIADQSDKTRRDLADQNEATRRDIAALVASTKTGTAGAGSDQFDFENDVHEGSEGQKWMDGRSYKTPKDKAAARTFAKKNGLRFVDDPKMADTLKGINTSVKDFDRVFSEIEPYLSDEGGLAAGVKGLSNTAQQFAKTDPNLGAYEANWETFVRAALNVIPAGRGFRMNEVEMKRILTENRPSLYDTKAIAAKKKKNVIDALKSAEAESIGAGNGPATPPAGGAPPPGDVEEEWVRDPSGKLVRKGK